MTLQSLLTRAQQATGADRELDALLECEWRNRLLSPAAFKDQPWEPSPGYTWVSCGGFTSTTFPDYTASVDAALELVERVLPGMEFHISTARHRKGWSVKTWLADDTHSGRLLDAPTPALALICALLTAKIAEAQPHEKED